MTSASGSGILMVRFHTRGHGAFGLVEPYDGAGATASAVPSGSGARNRPEVATDPWRTAADGSRVA